MSFSSRCADLFYLLPEPIRRWLRPALERVAGGAKGVRRKLAERSLPCTVVEASGLRVLMVGEDATASYLREVIFGEVPPFPEPTEHWPAAELLEKLAAHRAEYDLIIFGLGRETHPELDPHTFPIPAFVRHFIELPESAKELLENLRNHRERRKEINKIERNGFSYTLTQDEADLREFYERCHRPHILARHGDVAYVDNYEEFRRYFQRDGGLMKVMYQGKMAAGLLFQVHGTIFRGLFNGVRDADPELLQVGALAAEYYFMILEAHRRGCRRVEVGLTRTFLKCGVMQFKKKWDARFRPADDHAEEFRLAIGRWTPTVRKWLRENPFLMRFGRAEAEQFVECFFLGEADEQDSDAVLAGKLRRLSQPSSVGMLLWPLDAAARARCDAMQGLLERVDFPLHAQSGLGPEAGAQGWPAQALWPGCAAIE